MNDSLERFNIQKLTWIGKFLISLVIALSFIGCNYLYYNYIRTITEIEQSHNIVADEALISYTPFLSEGGQLEQVIRPQYSNLKSIIIRVRSDGAELDEDGVLKITLSQEDAVILEEEVDSSELADTEFYVVMLDRKLSVYKDYTLRIQQISSEQSYSFGVSQFQAEENKGNCVYNGVPQAGNLEVNYVYERIDRSFLRSWFIKDILFGLGVVLLIFLNKLLMRKDKIHKLLGVVYWAVIPLVTFATVELITGNLRTIGTEALWKNILIYYLVYFALSFVFLKISTLTFVYVVLFMLLALVQYFVTMFRGRPLMLQDIASVKTATTVASTYYFEINAILFYVLLFGILLLISTQFFRDVFLKRKYYVRVISLSISIVLLCGVKMKYQNILPSLNMWYLNENYQEYGLMLTLIGQVPYLKAEKPENYITQAVENIAENFSEELKMGNTPENIILIMNESFSDLEYLAEIKTDTELLPFWKRLSENAIKGYLSVPVFGAGTSNSEYEVLTGNSMEFVVSGSVPYQINVWADEVSMVSILEAQDYESVALHPYLAENWNRSSVYKNMGFDEFVSEENWGKFDKLRWCASDRSAYKKLIEVYEASDANLFAFLVTMQNHGGYAKDYDNFEVDVELNYNVDYPQAEHYLTLLQESDRAYQELIEYFEGEEESTMIIMFGDHQAAIENEYYEELFGKPLSELSFEEQQMRYITPFMIWTNYDIEEQDGVIMSSNYFGSYILDIAGVELPAYNQFLLDAMEVIPIIGVGGICDNEGIWYDWNNLPEPHKEIIDKYKMLQYNNIYDRNNRVDSVFEIAVEE